MSALKTLVPTSPPGAEGARPKHVAFQVPAPLISVGDGVSRRNDGASSSFSDMLAKVKNRSQERTSRTERSESSARETRREELSDKASGTDRMEERADRARDAKPAERSERAEPAPRREPRDEPAADVNEAAAVEPAETPVDEAPVTENADDADAESESAEAAPDTETEHEASAGAPSDDDVADEAVAERAAAVAEKAAPSGQDLLRQLARQAQVEPLRPMGAQADKLMAADGKNGQPVAQQETAAAAQSAELGKQQLQQQAAVEAPKPVVAERHAALKETADTMLQGDARGASQGQQGSGQASTGANEAAKPVTLRGPLPSMEMEIRPVGSESSSASGQLARLVAAAAGIVASDTSAVDPADAASPSAQGRDGAAKVDATGSQSVNLSTTAARHSAAGGAARTGAASFGQAMAEQRTNQADAARNMERMVEVVRANVGLRNSSITLRLDPPELGQIRLEAQLRGQMLSIRVEAETLAAREMLQSRAGTLRTALEQHGITIERFEIEPRPPAPPTHSNEAHQRGADGQQQSATEGGRSDQGQDAQSRSQRSSGDESTWGSERPAADDAAGQSDVGMQMIGAADPTAESSVNVLA
ncbi:MAG: flagellar hook-length control protein FliK [Phycisphaerae bacterium]|nr:flagellar hook-length control protein FliK [Phycisphaerae bacterium]